MKKKVLIFTGSPREDSYGASLARVAARGVKKAGGVAEIINLTRLKLNPCQACDRCRQRGPGQCFQEDDMIELYPLLKKAKAIILVHPVYWFTINAQTKIFIDRWYAFGGDNYVSFKNKKIGLILTFADSDLASSGAINAIQAYKDMFNYLESDLMGIIGASLQDRGQAKKDTEHRRQAYELGQEMAR
ncbi:MAG TPA: flavodoxin family protein [Candidatus Saccharicenans sp.]|nr:flavodoxin family protein [Candidatus Saccharicenans sp.]HRD01832.1 flavodoxin family protein [Candidatus Saccharicenans sp.]